MAISRRVSEFQTTFVRSDSAFIDIHAAPHPPWVRCSGSKDISLQYAMLRTPETTAYAFVDAINRHDLAELWELMSEEHRFVDSLGTVVESRERMRDGWAGYFRIVPDYAVAVDETFSHGPIVVMIGMARGTYAEDGELRPENVWRTPAV